MLGLVVELICVVTRATKRRAGNRRGVAADFSFLVNVPEAVAEDNRNHLAATSGWRLCFTNQGICC